MKQKGLLLALLCGCTASAQTELDMSFGDGQTSTVQIEGVPISYIDRGSGPTVVFYHGGADFRYWQFAIVDISKEFRTVALPREREVPFTYEYPTGLESFLEQTDDGPVNLVAHSSGAAQALMFAISRPEKLLSLTLIEPAFAPDAASMAALGMAMAANPVDPADCDLPEMAQSELQLCLF